MDYDPGVDRGLQALLSFNDRGGRKKQLIYVERSENLRRHATQERVTFEDAV
jgi:hypothetical protein